MKLTTLIAVLLAPIPPINEDPSDCEAVKLSIRDELFASIRPKHPDAGIGALTLHQHSERGSAWSAIVDLPDESVPFLIQLADDDPRAYICAEGEGQSNVSSRGGPSSIAGRVASDGGTPLAQARVSAELQCCTDCACPWGCACPPASRSRKYEPPLTVRTDRAGRFVLEGLQRGHYRVWVDAPGYGMEQREIETGAPPELFTFGYQGLVRLRVIANGARPADVNARYPGANDGTSVDAVTGLIELTLPALKPVRLEVAAAGMYPRQIEVTARAGAPGPPIDVVLSGGRAVEVKVIDDETRQPVPGARVSQWHPSQTGRTWGLHDDLWRGLVTGADGVALFEHFDPANAAVTVDSPAHVIAKVEVPAGRGVVTARLQRGATVFGRVLDVKERPYPNAFVELSRSDSQDRRIVTPDADGNYAIGGLSPGEYSVFNKFDWSGRVEVPRDAPQLTMHRIRIAAGERVLLDFRESSTTLTVVVAGTDRYPDSVQLWRGEVPSPGTLDDVRLQGDTIMTSSSAFSFQARKLTAGRYTLRVVARTHHGNVWGLAVEQRQIDIPRTGDLELAVSLTAKTPFFPCATPDCSR